MTPEPTTDLSAALAPPALDTSSPLSPPKKRMVLYFLILVAVALLPYLLTLRNGFVYDDSDQILANPYLRNFHHLREIFTTSVWSFLGDFRGSSNYYRPMMSVGYLFCYQLFNRMRGDSTWPICC